MSAEMSVPQGTSNRSLKDSIMRKETETIGSSELSSRLLVPVVVVLTFVAVLDAMQSYYIFFDGVRSAGNFIRLLNSLSLACANSVSICKYSISFL